MRWGKRLLTLSAFAILVLKFKEMSFMSKTLSLLVRTSINDGRGKKNEDTKVVKWWDTSDNIIRRWGCGRNETPLIYVHIGKSGGGVVRARFAASSLNYTKDKWHTRDNSFYPVGNHSKAYFCNGGSNNLIISPIEATFEGSQMCHATTPLGQAIACPLRHTLTKRNCIGCNTGSSTCNMVYVGHNYLGSEMIWLPPRYLLNWWTSKWIGEYKIKAGNPIRKMLRSLLPGNKRRCQYYSTIRNKIINYTDYLTCSVPLQREADANALQLMMNVSYMDNSFSVNWSPLYASLPLLRTVLVREPFSWLLSKYFWHDIGLQNISCDNITAATNGWAHEFALDHIFSYCGTDCMARYEMGISKLDQIERQAAGNLRQSFAVVGLLNETERFYDMLTARVGYMDMTLNPNVKGPTHPTRNSKQKEDCRVVFIDPSFQAEIIEASPVIATLLRLYKVAIEVNRFQLQELAECDNSFTC